MGRNMEDLDITQCTDCVFFFDCVELEKKKLGWREKL